MKVDHRADDQARAVDMLRASLASGKRRPVLQAPTGWGKTEIARQIARLAGSTVTGRAHSGCRSVPFCRGQDDIRLAGRVVA